MSDTTADDITAELEQGIAEAKERARVEQRAAEADDLEHEVAMFRAGVPLHTRVGRLFADTYDGPVDDLDEIQAGWFETIEKPMPAELNQRLTAKRIARELRGATTT